MSITLHRFSPKKKSSEAWRNMGVPTDNRAQATRWHDEAAGIWTLWLENPNGVNFESHDKGATLVVTPWADDGKPRSWIHEEKSRQYWRDRRNAAGGGRMIRIFGIKWKMDDRVKFVKDPNGATIEVYWREMRAFLHKDGHRIVLTAAKANESGRSA